LNRITAPSFLYKHHERLVPICKANLALTDDPPANATETNGVTLMAKNQNSEQDLKPEEIAVVRALKQTALAMVLSKLQTRASLIDGWIENDVSSDRAELEALVDEAFVCLAELEPIRALHEPIKKSKFEAQRQASLQAVAKFHQEVVNILEEQGDAD